MEHHDNNEKPYECKLCNKNFKTKNITAYGEHYNKVHPRSLIQCRLCEKQMKTVKALKLHEDNVHFKKFKCDSCDQAFSQNSELQKHLKNKTPNNKKHFCSMCSFSACQKNGLTFHYKQKHDGLAKKLSSDRIESNRIESKPKVQADNNPQEALDDNIQIKVEQTEAPETETNEDETSLNNAAAKENANNLTLICKTENCLKIFQDLNTIIMHIYTDHKLTQSNIIIHCKFCKNRLLTHENLKLHVSLVHHDKKGFKCEFCFKEYSTCGHGGLENYVELHKNDENLPKGKKYALRK